MRVLLVHNRTARPRRAARTASSPRRPRPSRVPGTRSCGSSRSSDEIEHWPATKQATLPAGVVWSGETHRDLSAALRRERPDVVHVHNTFPLLSASVLYACRDAAVPVVTTLHNYRLAAPAATSSGTARPATTACTGCPCPGGRARLLPGIACRPPRRWSWPTRAHRQAWRSLVSAYVFISAAQRDLLPRPPPATGPGLRPAQHDPLEEGASGAAGAGRGLRRPAGRGQGPALADGRLGPLPRHVRRPGPAPGHRRHGATGARDGGLGVVQALGRDGRLRRRAAAARSSCPRRARSSCPRSGKSRSAWSSSRPWPPVPRRSRPGTARSPSSSRRGRTGCSSGRVTRTRSRWPSRTSRRTRRDMRSTGSKLARPTSSDSTRGTVPKHLLEIYGFAIAHPV